MRLAIHDACIYFSNYIFGPVDTTDASYAYYYSITDDDEEGIITVYLGYYAGMNGQGGYCAEEYPDGIMLSFAQCFNAMHNPVDDWWVPLRRTDVVVSSQTNDW